MLLGHCWRRHKSNGATVLFVLAVCTACAAALLLLSQLHECRGELHSQTQRYRQQQEALSAQLQVVYEHRSRLERSLHKERGEHKKTKEEFLVYKLETQETLNKEKGQNADLHTQLQSLQTEHREHRLAQQKALEECQQQKAFLHTTSQNQVASMQDIIVKLREESKLLRKAHQEVHDQLLSAQGQVEEFRQLRQALQKMPDLRARSDMPSQARAEKLMGSDLLNHKVTPPPISEYKQQPQQETLGSRPVEIHSADQKGLPVISMDKKAGAEGKTLELDSQTEDQNVPKDDERLQSQHEQDAGPSQLKGTSPEEIDVDNDMGEKQGDGELQIDPQGEEMPQGQGIILQEPMDDWRIGEREDPPEQEDDEEKDDANETKY